MRLPRPGRRTALAGVVIVAAVVALRIAAPPLANKLLVDRLAARGVDATIGDVSLNLFSGQLVAENARGQNADGYGFRVKRLAVAIDYLPLFAKRLDFDYVRAHSASVDVHRGPRGAISLGGARIVAPAGQRGPSNWQLGFHRLALDDVTTRFTQSSAGGRTIRHRVRFRDARASGLLFYQPGEAIAIQAHAETKAGALGVDGTLSPFGPRISADFKLTSQGFALAQLARVTEQGSFERVAAHADTTMQVTFDWPRDAALSFAARGTTTWHQPVIATKAGLTVAADRFDWQGAVTGKLLRHDGKPGEIDSDGALAYANLRVDRPDTLAVDSPRGRWNGKTRLRLASATTRLASSGKLESSRLAFGVPQTFRVRLEQMRWNGDAGLAIGRQFVARHAQGTLDAAANHLELAGAPLRVDAAGFSFNGRYQSKPGPNGQALRLGIAADVSADRLVAVNTGLDAYWAALTDVRAQNLRTNTLADFSIDRFQARRTRLFQRPGFSASEPADHAPIRIDALDAKRVALKNLRAYSIDRLGLAGVDLRLFRDPNGGTPALRFFARSGNNHKRSGTAQGPTKPVTVAVKHATIDQNSTLYFRDASVDPRAKLTAQAVEFTLNDLDTGARDEPATFRLSARLGKYSRISADGGLAITARGKPDGRFSARVRSLSLPPLSGYMNKLFSQGIRSGRLDATVNAKVDSGDLGGNLKVLLYNFYVDNGQSSRARASIGVPLSTALATLRTDNEVIKLSAGLVGTLTSPGFSTANLVREAVFAAFKSALMSNFSPVGWLHNIGSALADLAGGKKLHAVEFEKDSDYITADSRVYLAQVRTVLADHAGASLKITGQAARGGSQLADARAQAVYDYLAARGVAPSRLSVQPAQTPSTAASGTVSLIIHRGSGG